MKEVKSFFTEDNRLNKGYADDATSPRDNFYRRKMSDTLPPPDVLAMYEEIHPGTFEKLMTVLDKEQKHRHMMDQINAQMQAKAHKMGRVFGFFIICVICYTVLELAKHDMLTSGLIFAGIAFTGIFGVSIMMRVKSDRRPQHDERYYNRKKRDNVPHTSVPEAEVQQRNLGPKEKRAHGRAPRRRS